MSRISPGTKRIVKLETLRELVPEGQVSALARKIDPDHPVGPRRNIQRAREKGKTSQATAEAIGAALGIDPEIFLEPLERPDPRVLALRSHLRKAGTIRAQLGWDPCHSELERLARDA